MMQKTLADYQSTEYQCPSCPRTSPARVGLAAHHRSTHGERLAAAELREKFGVPPEWLLRTMHHTLSMTLRGMAEKLPCSRPSMNGLMDDVYDIHRRGPSEAQQLKADQMTEAEWEQQTAAAHEKTRELVEKGESALQQWWRENPERAREMATEAAALGAAGREKNGMAGVTGQEHPRWHGGKSIYDSVKKQLPGRSWGAERDEHRADECRMCDETESLQLHHVIPILAGGVNEEWNYMTLCRSCHKTVEWRTWDLVSPVLKK